MPTLYHAPLGRQPVGDGAIRWSACSASPVFGGTSLQFVIVLLGDTSEMPSLNRATHQFNREPWSTYWMIYTTTLMEEVFMEFDFAELGLLVCF